MQSVAGGNLVRLDTAVPYSGSYNDVVDQGQREVNAGFEPELKPLPINVADYDVIAVGTPTWWYTMAPAVKTFLHGQNFAGKTVVPFMTNGGWPGRVIKDMKAACPGAVGEAANVAELLMSDKGAFITGSTFLIDGGATASYFYGPLRPENACFFPFSLKKRQSRRSIPVALPLFLLKSAPRILS